MAGKQKREEAPDARDVAAYVATLAEELKVLVEPYQLRALAYLLDLVRLEAQERARESETFRTLK